MKRFFGRIEIRNECLHLTVKVEMYAYIFIYILSNGCIFDCNIVFLAILQSCLIGCCGGVDILNEHCTLGILKFIQNQVKWELEKGKENRSRETMFTKYKNSVIISLLFY